jgi:hypothetical protein
VVILLCSHSKNSSMLYKFSRITNRMVQNRSWEAHSHSASQEITCLKWKPGFHYCVQKSPLHIPILRQVNPVHIVTPYLFKINFNIILPSVSRSSKQSRPFSFPTELMYAFLTFWNYTQHRYKNGWYSTTEYYNVTAPKFTGLRIEDTVYRS